MTSSNGNISALLALYAANAPVTGGFPSQRPVMQSCDVFFYLCLNKRLSKQTWGWWFETQWRLLWYHCNIQCQVALSLELLHDIWELTEFTKSTHVQAETWFNHLILAARSKIKMPLQARQIVTWFLVISFRWSMQLQNSRLDAISVVLFSYPNDSLYEI